MNPRADPDGEAEASGAGCAEAVVSAGPARPAARAIGVLAGFREPVVLVLLLIAFFTYISGKPLDGVLMVIVAVGLAWDAGRRPRAGGGVSDAGQAVGAPELSPERGRAHGRWRLLGITGMLAGGAVYAGVVGSFSRYSWPATAGIIGLGTVVVLIGWHGPLRHRRVAGRLPLTGALAWAVVLVFGCLWELAALLLQPSITTGSYAHPTISTLTDPVLSTWPGRSVLLAAWLAFGWYLAER
jgi:hypothetical protein